MVYWNLVTRNTFSLVEINKNFDQFPAGNFWIVIKLLFDKIVKHYSKSYFITILLKFSISEISTYLKD